MPAAGPARDAAVVAQLRAAGAVILGKTVTTECATYAPGKTRNPHDPTRTPGGSSAGSAAAVAAGMVPLAIGTQIQRVDHPAGVVLRRLRLQADARTDLAPRHPQALALARLRGRVRALARRPRAGHRAAHRLRRERSRHAAARAPSAAGHTGRRAAAAAAVGTGQDADLGARRRNHASGLRRARGRARRAMPSNTRCPTRWRRPGTGTARSWRPRWRPTSTSNTKRAASSSASHCAGSWRAAARSPRWLTSARWPRCRGLIEGFDELFANFDAIVTPATLGTAPPLDVDRRPGVRHACGRWPACRR